MSNIIYAFALHENKTLRIVVLLTVKINSTISQSNLTLFDVKKRTQVAEGLQNNTTFFTEIPKHYLMMLSATRHFCVDSHQAQFCKPSHLIRKKSTVHNSFCVIIFESDKGISNEVKN